MSVKARDIHARSLATSTFLSVYYIPNFIAPLEVFRVLNEARLRFMLLGTHALGGWMREPRTTTDVDILVGPRGHKKAVRLLLDAFPQLSAEEGDDETHLAVGESGRPLIDVMKSDRPLYRRAFKHTHEVQSEGERYWIPALEVAVAMKFAAMISPTRDYADRYGDAHDFLCMIQLHRDLNLVKLHALGQLMAGSDGDAVVKMVRRVWAGEKFILPDATP